MARRPGMPVWREAAGACAVRADDEARLTAGVADLANRSGHHPRGRLPGRLAHQQEPDARADARYPRPPACLPRQRRMTVAAGGRSRRSAGESRGVGQRCCSVRPRNRESVGRARRKGTARRSHGRPRNRGQFCSRSPRQQAPEMDHWNSARTARWGLVRHDSPIVSCTFVSVQSVARTSRPGSAPVGMSRSMIGVPETSVRS